MALGLLTKLFLYQKGRFPQDKVHKYIQYGDLGHAYKPIFFFFLRLPIANSFLAPFLSFFSALFISLPFTFHILPGCRNMLGVHYGQSLEIGP